MKNKPVFGIIGGNGGIGKTFSAELRKLGYKTLIASRSSKLSPEACAQQSDITVISVPIRATVQVIRKLGPLLGKNQALMDFTSLKEMPVKEMLACTRAEVIGCHPVFGPSVSTLCNQVIVLTPGRGTAWFSRVKKIFLKTGAVIKVAKPAEHDRIMAVVQGLMHFTSITLINTLKTLNFSHEEIDSFSSPVYRIRMDFACRILNQNPELYADIEMLNNSISSVLSAYLAENKKLFSAVKHRDREAFIRAFKRASDYLGSKKKSAELKTNKLIDFSSLL